MTGLLADAPHKQYFETAAQFENEIAAKHFLGAIEAKHGGGLSNGPYLLATNLSTPRKVSKTLWVVDYAVQQNQAEFWRGVAAGLRMAYTVLT